MAAVPFGTARLHEHSSDHVCLGDSVFQYHTAAAHPGRRDTEHR